MKIDEICNVSDGDFFSQTLIVNEFVRHTWEYCKEICANKKVLHIGCSDYPIYKGGENLHTFLSQFSDIIGCDTNGLDILKKYCDGVYYNSIEEVVEAEESFDVILIPNVLEHISSAGDFMAKVFKIEFETMFILVPNYFVSQQAVYENGIFTERIHPDHYAWYSPYTLLNIFKQYIVAMNLDCQLTFFDNKNMIGLCLTK